MIETITPLPENNNAFVPNNITFLREEDAARYNKQFSGFVYSGGLAPITANFTHTISPFEAFVHGYFVSQAATLMTYTPNRRTYAFIDSVDSRASEITFSGGTGSTFKQRLGNLVFAECAVGSAQPTPSIAGLIPLLFTDTGAASIIDVTDLRTLSPIVSSTKVIDPASYGLVGDNLTDNSDEFQEMLDALPRGSIIRFGQGIYRFDTKIFVRNSCTIEGAGPSGLGTVLRFTHPSSDMMEITATEQVVIQNLSFDASVTRTGGSALLITGNSLGNKLDNVSFIDHFTQVTVTSGSGWSIQNCYFINAVSTCIDIQNSIALDNASISNNLITGPLSSGVDCRGVRIRQGSNIEIVNNRFSGYRIGVEIDPIASCSGAMILNNILNNQSAAAIYFQRSVGVAAFFLFQICNNNISSGTSTRGIAINATATNVFNDGIISGNEINLPLTNAIGVLLGGDTRVLIEGNNFNLPAGVSDTSVCIQLTIYSTDVNIGANSYHGKFFVFNSGAVNPIATPITLATGSITIDPPSIAGNSQVEVIIALAAARVGDVLTLNRPSLAALSASIGYMGCRVPSDGNIGIFLFNEAGGAIDPPAATWTGTLIRGLL